MALSCIKNNICIIKRNNCLNCLHLFRIKNKFKSHKKVCENKNFCNIVMSSEDKEFNKVLEFDKAPSFIYANLKCLIEKIDGCKSNPENSSTAKVGKHIPSGFLNVYNIVI